MSTFKKFKPVKEFLDTVKDPFREGVSVWVKKIRIDGVSAIQLVASVDGIEGAHTAIISVHSKSLDNFGEELASDQRIILHQKDFKIKDEAIDYLKSMENKVSYK
jgi:hypothetical protein